MSVTKLVTAVGDATTPLFLKVGESVSSDLVVGGGDTFTGRLLLQRASSLNTFKTINTHTSIPAGTLVEAHENVSDNAGYYVRYICDDYTGDNVTVTVTPSATDTERGLELKDGGIQNADGEQLVAFDESKMVAKKDLSVLGQAYSGLNALTDAAVVATDCSLGNTHSVTLAGNRTLGAPTNQVAGATYLWVITQDGTGTRTLAYNAVFKFPGGTAPTLTTAAGSVDIISGVSDGTNILASSVLDLQ